MSVVLYEQPIAAYCWKALISLEERQVAYDTVLVEDVQHLDRHGDAAQLVYRNRADGANR